nr:F0F1 ATP synthase subunit A [Brevibacillus massiliensis]
MKKLEHYTLRFRWLGMVFDIPTMIMTVITAVIVFLFLFFMTRRMHAGVPSGRQNVIEWVFDFVRGIAGNFMDAKTATKFVTLGLTLFIYIFISNQLGVAFNITTHHTGQVSERVLDMLSVSGTPEAEEAKRAVIEEKLAAGEGVEIAWWKSPTATPSVTFALALCVLLYSHYIGIRKSFSGWFKHVFLNPIHILEEFIIKPLTLPLRLFGNIFAGEVLIGFLLAGGVFASIPLFLWEGYSVFVGSIQAFIFLALSMVYISQQANDGH